MDRNLLTASSPAMTGLVEALDRAVGLGDVTRVTERIKDELVSRSQDGWLDHCNLYEPQESGWYRRVPRKLRYDH